MAAGALALPVRAHEQTVVYVTAEVSADELRLAVGFRPSDLVGHFGLDRDGDGVLADAELAGAETEIAAYLAAHVRAWDGTTQLVLAAAGRRTTKDEARQPLIAFDLSAPTRGRPAELGLEVDVADRLGAQSVSVVKVVDGARVVQAILDAEHPRRRFVLSRPRSLVRQVGEFTRLGIEHIFLGFDHVLFLLALIVTGRRLAALVRIVTAFTVAHSATLVLAALDVVRLPPRWVEVAIALSIAYVAAENLWPGRENTERWASAFVFGLLHGFGFANVLRDLGLPTRGLVASLLAFNVGVEIGQLCIVAGTFPIVVWMAGRPFRRTAVQATSALILVAALGWVVERAFGIELMPF